MKGNRDRDKIAVLAEAFANISMLHKSGETMEDGSIGLGLHYLTIANAITSKISSSRNTLFKLVSSDGTEILILVGEPKTQVVVKIKNNNLVWKTLR